MEIFAANRQWSSRPEDERFTSLEALYNATRRYADQAREKTNVPLSSLRVENFDGDLQLVGRLGIPAKPTNWAFKQLASRIAAPAGYLQSLPATLAAQNVNHGLAHRVATKVEDALLNLLFHQNGSLVLRSLNTEIYQRVWNWEIAERLLALKAQGWDVARPDIRVQDNRVPLYASDHDLFAFVRSYQVIAEDGNPDGLKRGVIVQNSEVGASKLKLTRFLYREMCGNHIIWGAEQVVEFSARHVGNIREKLALWDTEIRSFLDESASDDEAKIRESKRKFIAGTKEDVLDTIFGLKVAGLTRKTIDAGYDATVPEQDGSPNTVWGLVQGITRHSQTVPYADERTAIDRAAGKLLEATF